MSDRQSDYTSSDDSVSISDIVERYRIVRPQDYSTNFGDGDKEHNVPLVHQEMVIPSVDTSNQSNDSVQALDDEGQPGPAVPSFVCENKAEETPPNNVLMHPCFIETVKNELQKVNAEISSKTEENSRPPVTISDIRVRAGPSWADPSELDDVDPITLSRPRLASRHHPGGNVLEPRELLGRYVYQTIDDPRNETLSEFNERRFLSQPYNRDIPPGPRHYLRRTIYAQTRHRVIEPGEPNPQLSATTNPAPTLTLLPLTTRAVEPRKPITQPSTTNRPGRVIVPKRLITQLPTTNYPGRVIEPRRPITQPSTTNYPGRVLEPNRQITQPSTSKYPGRVIDPKKPTTAPSTTTNTTAALPPLPRLPITYFPAFIQIPTPAHLTQIQTIRQMINPFFPFPPYILLPNFPTLPLFTHSSLSELIPLVPPRVSPSSTLPIYQQRSTSQPQALPKHDLPYIDEPLDLSAPSRPPPVTETAPIIVNAGGSSETRTPLRYERRNRNFPVTTTSPNTVTIQAPFPTHSENTKNQTTTSQSSTNRALASKKLYPSSEHSLNRTTRQSQPLRRSHSDTPLDPQQRLLYNLWPVNDVPATSHAEALETSEYDAPDSTVAVAASQRPPALRISADTTTPVPRLATHRSINRGKK